MYYIVVSPDNVEEKADVYSLVGENVLLSLEQFGELLFASTPQVSHLSLALSPRGQHH